MGLLQRTLASRFLRESSTLQAASVLTAASNFAGTIFLAHVLGVSELAVFYLAVTAYSLLWSLMNLGLAAVATSRMAGALQAGKQERMVGWVGVLIRLSVVLAVALAVIGAVVLPFVCERIFSVDGARIGFLAALLALIPLVDVPRVVVSAALQAERRMLPLARIDTGQEMCRVVFVVAGALAFGSALGPVVGMLAASVCGSLIALDGYRQARKIKECRLPSLGAAVRSRAVPTGLALREGIKVGVVRNVDSLGMETLPTLILGSLGDQKWVTYLRFAQRMIQVARMLMQGINRAALPALSELAGVKDLARLRRTYWRASLLAGATITGGLLITLPFLPYLIRALFPESYWEPVWLLTKILAPGLAIMSFCVANDVFYLVTGQMRVAIVISLVGLVYNTLQVAVLAYFFPEVGVAIGLTLTCLFSLVHMAYAWHWFRKNDHLFLRPDDVREAQGAGA